jgi:hypothetical protein
MNTETANQIARTLKQRTVGVEIECHIPAAAERSINADIAAVLEYNREAWNTTTRTYWKGITDGSLEAPRGYVGREYVSPPLLPAELFLQLPLLLQVLELHGARVNKSCGFHVHIDGAGYTPKRMQYLINHYAKSETALDCLMPLSRRESNTDYCKSVRNVQSTMLSSDGRIRYGRYYKLNLASFAKHGTVEFRHHSGTLDFEKMVCWIALCHATAERCRLKVPVTETYQNPMHNVLIAIKIATANIDGTLEPVTPAHRPLIEYVIERMHGFGFGSQAPVLS